jgi:hypothetical protein
LRVPNLNFEVTSFLINTGLGQRIARGLGFAAVAAPSLFVLSACGGEAPDTVNATYYVNCPDGSVADPQVLGTGQTNPLNSPATVVEIGCNDGAGNQIAPEEILTERPATPEPNMMQVDISGTELPGPFGTQYDSSIGLTHEAGKNAVVVLRAVGDQSVQINTSRVINQTP